MVKQEHKLFRVGAAAHEVGPHPMTARRWITAGRLQRLLKLVLTADLLTLIVSFSGHSYGVYSPEQKELVKCAQAVITSP